MSVSEYRDALQSLDRSMDDIMEDADYIDSALLDPAYGEDECALEFLRKGTLGYLKQYVASMRRCLERAEERLAECEEIEKRMKEETDDKND